MFYFDYKIATVFRFSPDSDDEKTPFLHSKIKDDGQIKKEMAVKLRNVEYYEKEIYTLEVCILGKKCLNL